jgi:hypothetical protein
MELLIDNDVPINMLKLKVFIYLVVIIEQRIPLFRLTQNMPNSADFRENFLLDLAAYEAIISGM